MSRLELLNSRQNEAVSSWIHNNGIGTINAAVGFGKNFTAFKCVYKALVKGWINKGDTIWFFAETNVRETTVHDEAIKFKNIYNLDILKDFTLEFYCYQSLPAGDRVLDIYDEIHDTLTSKYYKNILDSTAKYKIGLSATIPLNSSVFRSELDYQDVDKKSQSDKLTKAGTITKYITKGQLLDILCPICFKYSLSKGIEEDILSPFTTTILEHNLDTKDKSIKIWKTKELLGTEYKYYSSRNRMMSYPDLPSYRKATLGKEMTKFLYNLPSKARVIKNFLKTLSGKTIIFGVELALLEQITDNVVTKDNAEQLINDFNNDVIDVIASSKKLKQGITLNGVSNCIIVSYYSKSGNTIQQLGRIVRYSPNKIAKLYIVVTQGTYEESRWFPNMSKVYDVKGNVIDTINLNIKTYESTKDYL